MWPRETCRACWGGAVGLSRGPGQGKQARCPVGGPFWTGWRPCPALPEPERRALGGERPGAAAEAFALTPSSPSASRAAGRLHCPASSASTGGPVRRRVKPRSARRGWPIHSGQISGTCSLQLLKRRGWFRTVSVSHAEGTLLPLRSPPPK